MNNRCDTCSLKPRAQLRRLGNGFGPKDYVVALAGNPNTGKSTVFNALTGLKQHTGNWPGKTVTRAEGSFSYNDKKFGLIDLPGTYSLLSTSEDEEVARDFVLFGKPDVTVIVVDATRLERNLGLVFQLLEITGRAVLCLNLVDEARKHAITVDTRALTKELGIPVVATNARAKEGLNELVEAIHLVASGEISPKKQALSGINEKTEKKIKQISSALSKLDPTLPNTFWLAMRLIDNDSSITNALQTGTLYPKSKGADLDEILKMAEAAQEQLGHHLHADILEAIYKKAEKVVKNSVQSGNSSRAFRLDRAIDNIVTHRFWGLPIMLALLGIVLWITITGANYPSRLLSGFLVDFLHPHLKSGAISIGLPWWISGLFIDGIYLATAWVVSVMLPPMAIFFPLFTLLEDFGYLPRVAFNLDHLLKKSGAHGKQALTMTMGFGCNAAGVVATRIISSPREKLIAIITNNFSVCNGRWPTLIIMATIFLGVLAPSTMSATVSMLAGVGVVLLGILFTFFSSWLLSRTLLKGEASFFVLELPPYRTPNILQTLYTSFIDRTLIILGRAVMFAIPAGAVIWLISNINIADQSVAVWLINGLDPLGILIGLNGVILLAYVVAIPANEIVIPTIMMLTTLLVGDASIGQGAGVMFEGSTGEIATLLQLEGWTTLTGINLMLFSLLHNPCSTTIYTIYKETRSAKWTTVATFLPLLYGFLVCFLVTTGWNLFI